MAKIVRRSIAILLTVTAVILLVLPALTVSAVYSNDDFTIDGGVLKSYTGSEHDLTIPLGVTEIGKDAFSGNNNLTSVYIPEEVTLIDYAAFENCKNLQKVVIEGNVKSIGSSAFSGCTSLNTINIPKKCESLGSGVFAACPNLSYVTVDSGNRNFICLDGVIYSKDGHKLYQYLAGRPFSTYEIPQPVVEIGEFGFYGANMLTDVTIAKGVEEIPEYGFLNCQALSKVTIPSTVKAIRRGAFGGCPNLTELAVPASVGYIDKDAFTSLEGVKGNVVETNSGAVLSEGDGSVTDNEDGAQVTTPDYNEENSASENTDSDNPDNPENEENISDNIENSLENLADKIKDTVENVTESIDSALSNELGRTNVVGGEAVFLIDPKSMKVKGFDMDAAQTEDSVSESGNTSAEGEDIKKYSGNEFDVIDGQLGHYGNNDAMVEIPSDITKLGNRVFYNNKTIQQVGLPSGLKEIGDFTFARSSLSDIDIPNGVEKIGYAAFYNCKNLGNVNIPASVNDIELGAFDGSKYIDDWKKIEDGNNFLIVGDGILLAYKGYGDVINIPETVKQIGPGVFEGDTKITSVTLPETVKKIGEDAFNGCLRLTNVTLPNNLEIIEDRAFKDTSIKNVTIPVGVKSIGLGAFDTEYINGGLDYVIFKGNDLPDTSYKPTAQRLSASDLRTNAFNGTKYALITAGTDVDSGTILDPHTYGFRGQVFSYADKPSMNGAMQVELRRCTREPDINGNVEVDSELTIDGYKCVLSGVKQSAFDEYRDPSWCKNALTGITLEGEKSAALEQLISDVTFSISSGDNTSAANDISAITVNDNGLFNGKVQAVLPDNTEKYNMVITSDTASRPAFEKAFDNRYGTHAGVQMENIAITMTDRLNQIPIKKMATSKLELTMPAPASLANADKIRVATLDESGLLEEVSTRTEENDLGNKNISFVVSHLSPYIIYTMSGNYDALPFNEIMDEGEAASEDMDELPENSDEELETETVEVDDESHASQNTVNIAVKTLNKNVFHVPVRVIISIILLALAAILFLYKGDIKLWKRFK